MLGSLYEALPQEIRQRLKDMAKAKDGKAKPVPSTTVAKPEERPAVELVMGIDFGTSATKVVIQAPHFTGNPAYAVPFGQYAHHSLKYLLPTRLFVAKDGHCRLNRQSDEDTPFTHIKQGLMQSPEQRSEIESEHLLSVCSTAVASAYLALVLKYVRQWFDINKRMPVFGGERLEWAHHFGLPAAIDNNQSLKRAFDAAGKVGWNIAQRRGPVMIHDVQKAVDDFTSGKFKADDIPEEILQIPEVVAQVIGYTRSPKRREGLHLLVDVGAGTLDICSFIVRSKSGDDNYPILTAQVRRLGAQRLHQARIHGAKNAVNVHAKSLLDLDDPLSVMPDDKKKFVPTVESVDQGVNRSEERFHGMLTRVIYGTLNLLKLHRHPNSSVWREQLPVFICGGASKESFFEENLFSTIDGWLRNPIYVSNSKGLRIPMDKPEGLDANISVDSYHRLAVAWGLSHQNIPEHESPANIDNVETPEGVDRKGLYVNSFISKEMV